jgi:hypothetical protein
MRWSAGVPLWVKVIVITPLGVAPDGRGNVAFRRVSTAPAGTASSAGFDAPAVYSAKAASFLGGHDWSALSGR